jgi:predicted dehydrogenase
MQRGSSRRQFLQTATVGAAALTMNARSYARVAGSNDRISIGLIGCGGRGLRAHMEGGVHPHAKSMNCEVVAVADPWRQRREEAAAKAGDLFGRPAEAYEAAAKAKKDIYCEKPLGMDFQKTKRAVDAVKAANVVCQVGTQVRSYGTSTACRQLMQSGMFGNVARIQQCRNSAQPYWYSRLREVDPRDVEWSEFLMDAPKQPFNADKISGWYGYREFSDGPVPGLGSHFIDLLNYIMGSKYPESATGQHGTFTWIDEHGFTCPDQVQATWTYPEGFMVSYSTNFGNSHRSYIDFIGDEGVLSLTPWTRPTYFRGGVKKSTTVPAEETAVEEIPTPDHFLDWLQCVRSRNECRAPIEAGMQHAVAVIMAVKAADTGRRQVYDPVRREIKEG